MAAHGVSRRQFMEATNAALQSRVSDLERLVSGLRTGPDDAALALFERLRGNEERLEEILGSLQSAEPSPQADSPTLEDLGTDAEPNLADSGALTPPSAFMGSTFDDGDDYPMFELERGRLMDGTHGGSSNCAESETQ